MIILLRKAVSILAPVALVLSLSVSCSSSDDDDDDDDDNFTLNGAGSGATELLGSAPSEAAMGVYQFAVSTSEDCSNPVIVIDNGDTPSSFDMLESPEIGKAVVPDGTYPCVILVMSPQLTVTPSTDDGSCEEGTSFVQNVCGGNGSDGRTVDLDGEVQTCGESTDKAYLYLSTLSTLTDAYEEVEENCDRDEGDDSSCNSFEPPSSDSKALGVPLGAELVVSGDAVGVLTLGDLDVQEEGDDECGLQRPSFTFTAAE